MHPIHDIDLVIVLALMLASKRRPAELTEIIAATDLLYGPVPPSIRMVQAFARLADNGLVTEDGDRFSLTPAAQTLVTRLPKKADTDERIAILKERLLDYEVVDQGSAVGASEAKMNAAILAFRASTLVAGRNMLVPKPKPAETDPGRSGHWRKRPPPRKRG